MQFDIRPADEGLDCDFREGCALLVDKPLGWTSFDVVNKLRGVIRRRLEVKKYKVGHAGTLDPLATGLLIICVGKWTKRIAQFQDLPKVYSGSMRFGGVTPSYDTETEVTDEKPTIGLSEGSVRSHMEEFLGWITQKPPIYSAVKVGGTPLYRLARRGKDAEIPERKVLIERFDLDSFNNPDATFSVECSKGTYIRSLVHDLGQHLGCGAYMTSLKRTGIGPYRLADAWNLPDLVDAIEEGVPHDTNNTSA